MKICLVLLAAIIFPLETPAQTVDPAKRQQVLELIGLMNMDAVLGPMIDQCIVLSKGHNPEVPDAFWQQEKRILMASTGDYTDAMVAVFSKYFTVEDLKALVAFYKSPAGQHYLKAMPAMTQESMQTMATWAKASGAQTVARLRAAGYTPSH